MSPPLLLLRTALVILSLPCFRVDVRIRFLYLEKCYRIIIEISLNV